MHPTPGRVSTMNHTLGMRRRGIRRATTAFAAASVVVALAACAPSDNGNGAPEEGAADADGESQGSGDPDGTIRAGISYELGTNGYDPMTTSAALTVAVNWHTLEGLTELDPANGEPYNALAADGLEEVDETTYTATLREGAVFHDGTPVTADDVVFSFDRVLDPDNNSLYSQFIPFIESVEATDDTTVQLNLEYPVGVLEQRVAVVKIVPQAAVEEDLDAFDANPIGTGPYEMTDNGAGGTVKLERFDDYTGDHPAQVKELVWDVLPDATARVNALASDSVSAIDSVPYLDIETLEAQGADVESVQGFGLLYEMTDNGAGGTVKLERFDDYTGDHPAQVKELVWDVLPDATARVNALASDSVSAIDSVPYLDIETLEAQGADVESVQGFGLLFAMFNMSSDN